MKRLYHSVIGRLILKLITAKWISALAGKLLDTRASLAYIPIFIKQNKIKLNEVKAKDWNNFNEFFTRQLVPGARTIEEDPAAFISPCDALLKVYPIKQDGVYPVKDVSYTITDLIRDKKMAAEYIGGYCFVFRLTPAHYHRYIYPESGIKSSNRKIDGVLHTVKPVATEATDVFVQNQREYSIIESENFGPVVFMQVGALMVGKIVNYKTESGIVHRGEEAGRFEFGGSTIIVLTKADKVTVDDSVISSSTVGKEYSVLMGQKIGCMKQ